MLAEPTTMRLAGSGKRSLARKVNFTARTIAAFSLPQNRNEAALYDAKVPGLLWRLRRASADTLITSGFFFMKRIDGRKTCVKIGGPEITVDQARTLALAMAGDAAAGITPAERRAADKASTVTMGDLLNRWMEHARQHKRTADDDEAQIERYLTDWKARRLADIGPDAIRALHAKVGESHGHYAANRLLALLRAAYNKAGQLWEGANPARGIQRFHEASRERFLQADELPRFFKALADEPDQDIADAIKLCLLAGARRSNTLGARWADIDLARAVWTIPGSASKSRKPVIIPLSPPVVALLKARKASAAEDAEFVFPGIGATGHLIDIKISFKRLLKRAGIDDLRLHDLRRSLASWMAISGASLPVVGRALGHSSQQSTAVYARLSIDPVRAGIDTATAAIMAASKAGKKPRKAGK